MRPPISIKPKPMGKDVVESGGGVAPILRATKKRARTRSIHGASINIVYAPHAVAGCEQGNAAFVAGQKTQGGAARSSWTNENIGTSTSRLHPKLPDSRTLPHVYHRRALRGTEPYPIVIKLGTHPTRRTTPTAVKRHSTKQKRR